MLALKPGENKVVATAHLETTSFKILLIGYGFSNEKEKFIS